MDDTGPQRSAEELWDEALRVLDRRLVARPSFQTSIKQACPRAFADDRLELVVATDFARDWLEKLGREHLEAAATEVVGRPVTVTFKLEQMDLALKAVPSRRRRRTPHWSANYDLEGTHLNPNYTFENFVVGECNQFAHAAARAVADELGARYNPLFIYGAVGMGKTHLMQAIGHAVRALRPELRVEYASGDAFTFHVVTSIREDRYAAFRRKYREVDVWLIDDVQFICAKERTEAEFFQVFTALYEIGRQVVITSDRPPRELKFADPRLRSRFESGLATDIRPPGLATRMAILRHKARGEKAEVPEEALHYIAQTVKSNIRAMEGALISVLAAASLLGVPISLSLAMQQLRGLSPGQPRGAASIATVQQVVGEHFAVSVSDLTGARRTKELVFPRQVAMYLCREILNFSFPVIARAFGGKHHGTVIHACVRVRERMAATEVEALVNELSARVRNDA